MTTHDDIEAQLRGMLPPLGTQKVGLDLSFHARIESDDGGWCGYLGEGGDVGDKYVVRGWFVGLLESWQTRPLREILNVVEEDGVSVRIDRRFSKTTYSEIRSTALESTA